MFQSVYHPDIHSGTKELWEEVRRITSPANPYPLSNTIDSQILNDHYAGIPNNPGYCSPVLKVFVQPPADLVTEQQVFRLLDKLKHTASGPDNIPAWFLRLAAPVFAAPLSHLINISFSSAIVPMQWKATVMHPVQKFLIRHFQMSFGLSLSYQSCHA